MTVQVKFFAMLRDASGAEACSLRLDAAARGTDARAALVARYPRLRGLLDSTRLAVNGEYRPWDASLAEGDELALIPPVSGG